MDQSGEVLLKNGLAENKLREGVTTQSRVKAARRCRPRNLPTIQKARTQGISLNFGTYYSSGKRASK